MLDITSHEIGLVMTFMMQIHENVGQEYKKIVDSNQTPKPIHDIYYYPILSQLIYSEILLLAILFSFLKNFLP